MSGAGELQALLKRGYAPQSGSTQKCRQCRFAEDRKVASKRHCRRFDVTVHEQGGCSDWTAGRSEFTAK